MGDFGEDIAVVELEEFGDMLEFWGFLGGGGGVEEFEGGILDWGEGDFVGVGRRLRGRVCRWL